MEARASNWFNVEIMQEKFGIQVKHNGRWLHAAEEGKPLIFDTEKERDIKLAEVRKR